MSIGPPHVSTTIPSEAILEELRSLCESDTFARAGEARRLLRYLVETEQAGRLDDLREVQIGCDLYGREPSYDPKIDSIVRVSATRLRVRLEEHYAAHPSRVQIVLHAGSYVPSYRHAAASVSRANPDPPPRSEAPAAQPAPAMADAELAATRTRRSNERASFLRLAAIGILVALALAGAAFWARSRGAESPTGTAWIARPFSRLGGVEQFAAFAPDGRSVVFEWNRSPGADAALYRQELSGDVPHAVTGQHRMETRPA